MVSSKISFDLNNLEGELNSKVKLAVVFKGTNFQLLIAIDVHDDWDRRLNKLSKAQARITHINNELSYSGLLVTISGKNHKTRLVRPENRTRDFLIRWLKSHTLTARRTRHLTKLILIYINYSKIKVHFGTIYLFMFTPDRFRLMASWRVNGYIK